MEVILFVDMEKDLDDILGICFFYRLIKNDFNSIFD